MASQEAPKQKCEWLVILPDQNGALGRRMEVRAKHLENIKQPYDAGFWLWGGAMMSEQPREGQPLPIVGSAMLAYADSEEEVLEMIKKDIYVESQVWDLSKIQIWPFRSAIRRGLKGGK